MIMSQRSSPSRDSMSPSSMNRQSSTISSKREGIRSMNLSRNTNAIWNARHSVTLNYANRMALISLRGQMKALSIFSSPATLHNHCFHLWISILFCRGEGIIRPILVVKPKQISSIKAIRDSRNCNVRWVPIRRRTKVESWDQLLRSFT
jgi:hypothetical protein